LNYVYIEELEKCRSIHEVDGYFASINITDQQEQLDYLHSYMCILYYGSFGGVTVEENCRFTKKYFISGGWRKLTRKYEIIKLIEQESEEESE